MQTIGLVTKRENNYIEVKIVREESCGSSCENCSARCAQTNTIIQRYENTIGADPGDKIAIETKNSFFLKYMLLVYGLPLLSFLLSIIIFNKFITNRSNLTDLLVFLASLLVMLASYMVIRKFDENLLGAESANVVLKRI